MDQQEFAPTTGPPPRARRSQRTWKATANSIDLSSCALLAAGKTDRTREEIWELVMLEPVLGVSRRSGIKTWGVRYRATGARRCQKLGAYPQLRLLEARAAARDVQKAGRRER